jgi:hypothetical protein
MKNLKKLNILLILIIATFSFGCKQQKKVKAWNKFVVVINEDLTPAAAQVNNYRAQIAILVKLKNPNKAVFKKYSDKGAKAVKFINEKIAKIEKKVVKDEEVKKFKQATIDTLKIYVEIVELIKAQIDKNMKPVINDDYNKLIKKMKKSEKNLVDIKKAYFKKYKIKNKEVAGRD